MVNVGLNKYGQFGWFVYIRISALNQPGTGHNDGIMKLGNALRFSLCICKCKLKLYNVRLRM